MLLGDCVLITGDTTPPGWFGGDDLAVHSHVLMLVVLAVTLGLPALLCAVRAVCLLLARRRGADGPAHLISAFRLEPGWIAVLEPPMTSQSQSACQGEVRCVDDRYVAVALRPGGELQSLPPGSPVRVLVAGEGSAYWFMSAVEDARLENGTLVAYVQRPEWIEKVQRRAHFRVSVRLPATLAPLEHSSATSSMLRGIIEDLSASGLRVLVSAPVAAGARVRLRFSAAELGDCSFEARVVRAAPCSPVDGLRHRAHCELLYLAQDHRDRIVSYCFDVQRSRMRP